MGDRMKLPSSIYMNWGGTTPPEIRGDVTVADHIGWIELSSLQFGLGRVGAEGSGGADENPAVSEIVVTKVQDMASHALNRQCIYSEGKKVVIDFVKRENGKPNVYHTITLTGVLISSCGVSPNSSGGRGWPMESFSLTFTKAEHGPSPSIQPPQTNRNPAFWNIRPPAR